MTQSSSSGSLKKSTFKKMVLDFVSTLKNTPARDANEKAEMLEKIDQKIREGEKFRIIYFVICFEFAVSDLRNSFISAYRSCSWTPDPVLPMILCNLAVIFKLYENDLA